jgi:hypothetical protein
MKIRLSELKNLASSRPTGYVDDVVSHGIITGDMLEIDRKSYLYLVNKYNPTNSRTAQVACCGRSNHPLPPLKEQMKNAVKAAGRVVSSVVQNKQVFAEQSIIDNRYNICQGCEFLNIEKQRCSKCGCSYKTKIKLSTEKCPIGKW